MSKIQFWFLISLNLFVSTHTLIHAQSNPTPIATFEREEAGGGAFGYYMAHGDINRDGIDDLIVSDGAFDGGAYNSGRVYVFFGRSFNGAISASSADIKIDGIQQSHAVGIPKVGDIDGDEYADVAIGALNYFDSTAGYFAGRVYVFLGKSIYHGGTFTVNQADIVIKPDSMSKYLGLNTLCDFDDDGLDDLVMRNVPRDGYPGGNRVSILYGKSLDHVDSLLVTQADLFIQGPPNLYAQLLSSIIEGNMKLPDVNGDGASDLVVEYRTSFVGSPPDTIGYLYGRKGGLFGSRNFEDLDEKFSSGYDAGGFGQDLYAANSDYDGDGVVNVLLRNSLYHFDEDYTNQYGRVYMFKEPPQSTTALEEGSTKIRGTIAGILSGNFGLQMDFGDVDKDGINEIAVADYGYGYTGAQFLFRGRREWPDSLSDMDADVKIFGNSNYSGLGNGVMLADVMGTGKAQWLVAYDRDGARIDGFVDLYPSSVLTGIEEPISIPRSLVLLPNFPNPFNPSTTLTYELPSSGQVELLIFNVLGQKVRTLAKTRESSGLHKAIWDGKNNHGQLVASGIYIVRLLFGNEVKSRKVMLLK